MFKCTVCGYIHQGAEAPEKCPKCGAPREKFVQLEDEAVELINRSRFTNQLLADLYSLLEQAKDIGREGEEDNLDPACLAIFQRLQREAEILQQSVKAEIATHIAKNKWG